MAEVIFKDTVCQPTKDRQNAMERLTLENDVIIVIGGRNSNNTRQLGGTARSAGKVVNQIETASDLQAGWFESHSRVGVTAGTSTPDETVQAVLARLKQMDAEQRASSPAGRLAPAIQRACASIL